MFAAPAWLTTLTTQMQRVARQKGDALAVQHWALQRQSLRPIKYRKEVRVRMSQLAPRRLMTPPGNGTVLRPVIGVDVDGTLGDWHQQFRIFAEMYLQRQVGWEWDGEGSFWQSLGISHQNYRRLKLAFRQSGLKRGMPLINGALELVRDLRNYGCEIWVCTTRPYLRLDNIDPDTRWWLRHHKIPYDGVLFGERKWADLSRLVKPDRVLGILDDSIEQVDAARRAHLPAALVARPYTTARCSEFPVMTLPEARGFLLTECRSWLKERNVRAK